VIIEVLDGSVVASSVVVGAPVVDFSVVVGTPVVDFSVVVGAPVVDFSVVVGASVVVDFSVVVGAPVVDFSVVVGALVVDFSVVVGASVVVDFSVVVGAPVVDFSVVVGAPVVVDSVEEKYCGCVFLPSVIILLPVVVSIGGKVHPDFVVGLDVPVSKICVVTSLVLLTEVAVTVVGVFLACGFGVVVGVKIGTHCPQHSLARTNFSLFLQSTGDVALH